MQAGLPYVPGQLWNQLQTQKLPGLEMFRAKLPHPLADEQVNEPLKEGTARVPGITEPSFISDSKPDSQPSADVVQPAKGASQDILRADVKQAHHPAAAILRVAEVHDPTVLKPSPPPLSASSSSLAAGLKKIGISAAPLSYFFKTSQPAEIAAVIGERAAAAVSDPASIYPAKVNSSFWGKLPGLTKLAAGVLGGCASVTLLVWGISAVFSTRAARQALHWLSFLHAACIGLPNLDRRLVSQPWEGLALRHFCLETQWFLHAFLYSSIPVVLVHTVLRPSFLSQ